MAPTSVTPHTVLRGFIDLLYPPACCLCGIALPFESCGAFCTPCRDELLGETRPSCARCGSTVGPHLPVEEGCVRCRDERFHFDAVLRLGVYQGKLREAVLRMKHKAGESLAEVMGELWAEHAESSLTQLPFDLIVPIPLHWTRRLVRGHNQSVGLARSLARRLKRPLQLSCLYRIRRTPHQTGQTTSDRRRNLRRAFWAPSQSMLRGKTVLLVDDVITTGSTCSEAARALRKAGAARVIAAVLARTDS